MPAKKRRCRQPKSTTQALWELTNAVNLINQRLDKVEKSSAATTDFLSKWRGGMAVLLALATVGGVVFNFWHTLFPPPPAH